MKNKFLFIYLSIYLSILFLGLLAVSSCQEIGQDDLNFNQEEILKISDPANFSNNRNQTQQNNIPLRSNLFPVYEFGKIRTFFIIEKS